MKWGLASMILQENIFNNAIAQFLLRSSLFINGDASENTLYKDVLLKNIGIFGKKMFVLLFFVIAIWLLYKYISSGGKIIKKRMIPFIFISFYPFIWYFFYQESLL